jgi:hypothetical protein
MAVVLKPGVKEADLRDRIMEVLSQEGKKGAMDLFQDVKEYGKSVPDRDKGGSKTLLGTFNDAIKYLRHKKNVSVEGSTISKTEIPYSSKKGMVYK